MSYKVRNNLSPFFTAGRLGNPTNKVIVHHAATTDFDGIGRTFKVRGVSAHYGVGRNNNVDRYVPESSIAWHAGNWPANCTSIGIENVNKTGAPSWLVDDDTFDTLVELVRDIAKRHSLLPLKVGHNLFGHKDFYATSCPMTLYPRLKELENRVNGDSHASSKPSKGRKSVATLAKEVMAGLWGNGPARKANLERQGYDYNAVQAEVNKHYSSTTAPKKSVTAVAREVIAGTYGNGPARKANLERAGYNYNEVQKKVNSLLGVGKTVPKGGVIGVGQNVVVTNPVGYTGTHLAVSGTYKVMEVRGDRVVIGRGGAITAAINIKNIRKA